MATTVFNLYLAGRSGDRINVRREHLPAPVAKALDKLETANAARADADADLKGCGFGTGPQRKPFEDKTRKAGDAQLAALDELYAATMRHAPAIQRTTSDAYADAAYRFEKARGEMLTALEEISEAGTLHAGTRLGRPILDVHDRHARKNPAHHTAAYLIGELQRMTIPNIDA